MAVSHSYDVGLAWKITSAGWGVHRGGGPESRVTSMQDWTGKQPGSTTADSLRYDTLCIAMLLLGDVCETPSPMLQCCSLRLAGEIGVQVRRHAFSLDARRAGGPNVVNVTGLVAHYLNSAAILQSIAIQQRIQKQLIDISFLCFANGAPLLRSPRHHLRLLLGKVRGRACGLAVILRTPAGLALFLPGQQSLLSSCKVGSIYVGQKAYTGRLSRNPP